ncbi:MAG TPA: hydroxyacid dehydrogenase [Candidatus Magasanikbacteria bacterium]|nr:hydroxyacid dehydrogenase [Candidatus Magasanikbacteria bacterium]
MKKLNCAFYNILPDLKTYTRNKMSGFNLTISDKPFELEKLDSKTEILGIFVEAKIDKKVFQKLPNLKMIATFSTGYDHVDLKEAKKRKIPICNVPTYGENTVAQHAMALILAISKKIFASTKRVKEGNFDYHGLCGFDLKDKTVGIVGTGHIGYYMIKMLSGFDVNIIAYDPFPNTKLAKELNFKYVSLNKLLAESDIVSLHVPLLPQTTHMINKRNIKKMKPGVIIINTSRGGLIEPEALVWGLETGHIASAGIDVLEEERYISHPEFLFEQNCQAQDVKDSLMENIIIDHPNTIVTPHNAFNTTEAIKRIIDTSIANVKAFSKGETQNDVTKPRKK